MSQVPRVGGGPKNWNELFVSCPHIAEHVFHYLSVEESLMCGEICQEWALAVESSSRLKERAKKIPIQKAVEDGHHRTVGFQIGQGTESKGAVCRRGIIPFKLLMSAAERGHLSTARVLIDNGANVKAREDTWQWTTEPGTENWRETALTKAARKGHLDMARLLIENGADASAKREKALDLAARNGHREVARLLLENGAPLGDSLKMAALGKHVEMAKILIRAGADMTECLITAITPWQQRSYERVEFLVELGADINAHGKCGETPLTKACSSRGCLDIAEWLIEKGAEINGSNRSGRTPLIVWLSSVENLGDYPYAVDFARLCLEKGADPNAKDSDGLTPLVIAAGKGLSAMIELLITKGANVNTPDNSGKTPLMATVSIASRDTKELPKSYQRIAKDSTMIESLIASGANVNAIDNTGKTALMVAAESKGPKELSHKIAKLLIEKGADVSVVDRGGQSALTVARRRGDKRKLEKLLVQKGARMPRSPIPGTLGP